MAEPIALQAGSTQALAHYVSAQLHALFPHGGAVADAERLGALVPAALEKMRPMLAAIRSFTPGRFDHFHSLQYCAFLYLLSVEAAREFAGDPLADRLFGLNRALNAIDLYHAVRMPAVFFISHGLGSVLGSAEYGDRLVVFQNVTVGRVGDDRPRIGDDVVLYPGASVTGQATVGSGSVIAAGTRIHDESVPDGSLALMRNGELLCRPARRDYASLYFRS